MNAHVPPLLHTQRGFTLIELMVVVALVAILASLAVPSFSGMIANQRVSTAAQELQVLLQFARAEAVYRRTPTQVVQTSQAWQAQTDKQQALRELTLSSAVSVYGAADGVEFGTTGRAKPVTGSSGNPYTLRISGTGASRVQCLSVIPTGLVRMTRVAGAQDCS